ncbi:MAG: C69 family dipeptidase [Candidatus Latescibacteria bacterium]|nr:C69 family dipeptidase [Candidatus Latescibacterota bacterium]
MFKISFMVVLIVLLSVTPAFACYSIVAGKKATVDGSVLFGHNEDNARKFVAGLWKVNRTDHASDEFVKLQAGARLPQVKTTYGYLWCQMPELDYSDGLLNEYGVAVASDNCPSREDNPELTGGGIGGPVLRRLVAERARTAREGVKLVGSLIEQYGYTASGRTMVICDPEEGWLVSMVNGKHWVAARVPDDMVAIIANTYTIREVDLADTLNYLGSPDLIAYAEKRGWYNPSEGPFSFEKAYANPDIRVSTGNTHRQWSGLRLLSAEPVPLPEEKRLPFAVKPKEPLTVDHITAVLRDHYENTPYEPEKDYQSRHAHKRHTSTICSPGTNSSHVFQLRSWLPVDIGAVWWLAMWQPCSTPYIPLYAGMDTVPGQLEFGGEPGENCVFCVVSPEFGPAYQVFYDLSGWINEHYAHCITPLREQWRVFEKESYDIQPQFEDYVLGQWKMNPSIARRILSRYCDGVTAEAVYKARLFMTENKDTEIITGSGK